MRTWTTRAEDAAAFPIAEEADLVEALRAGFAAIRAGLDAARAGDENFVMVLGHAGYYRRFGFTSASGFGVRAPSEVPDEAMMALLLAPARPVPDGRCRRP